MEGTACSQWIVTTFTHLFLLCVLSHKFQVTENSLAYLTVLFCESDIVREQLKYHHLRKLKSLHSMPMGYDEEEEANKGASPYTILLSTNTISSHRSQIFFLYTLVSVCHGGRSIWLSWQSVNVLFSSSLFPGLCTSQDWRWAETENTVLVQIPSQCKCCVYWCVPNNVSTGVHWTLSCRVMTLFSAPQLSSLGTSHVTNAPTVPVPWCSECHSSTDLHSCVQ